MRLDALIEGLELSSPASGAVEVVGVSHDSRRVGPGELFVAIPGARYDGRDFAGQAVRRGAVAVVGRGAAPDGLSVPWLAAEDPRSLLGPLAARVYGHPDRELLTVGVTGTNGKTTVVHLLGAILEAAGRPTARLGTLGYQFRSGDLVTERTTPEASELFRLLRRMRREGAEAVALEVSSHALALGRVAGAAFDLALFTNLTRDHLDFHRDLEEYFAAKRALFDQLKPEGRAVINVADPFGERLAAELPGALTFGRGGAVSARRARLDLEGIRAVVDTPAGELRLRSRLLGRFNLDNLVAAVAGAVALDLPAGAIAAGLAAAVPLPGRLQPVAGGQPFPVLIDYAHTPAALAAALSSLRELAGRRLIVVFGCGGDRDPGKRGPMGRAAGELADLPILTSDNPRGEEPAVILAAVEQGLRASGNRDYLVVPDRRDAIRRALSVAGEESVVLIAGKGHEAVQIVGDERLPFSDYEETQRALEERFGPGPGG